MKTLSPAIASAPRDRRGCRRTPRDRRWRRIIVVVIAVGIVYAWVLVRALMQMRRTGGVVADDVAPRGGPSFFPSFGATSSSMRDSSSRRAAA